MRQSYLLSDRELRSLNYNKKRYLLSFAKVASVATMSGSILFGVINSCCSTGNGNNPYIQEQPDQTMFINSTTDSISEETEKKTELVTLMTENKKPIATTQKRKSKQHKYKISKVGMNHIKKYESCRLHRYRIRKPNGKYEKYETIGWGHQIYPSDPLYNNKLKKISQKHADRLFERDCNKLNISVNRLIGELNHRFSPSQGFIDGLASLVYNCGERGVRESTFFQRMKRCRFAKQADGTYLINESDYYFSIAAVKTMKIFMKGHKPRRKAEHRLMAQID